MTTTTHSTATSLTEIHPDDPDWVATAHRQFNITSWAVQNAVNPITISGGEGCWFWDASGKRFLDFQSQLVNLNLGHQHPRLVESIQRQAAKLCYIGPSMANDARSELAALLAQVTPGDLKASFFTTGGAAANETAVRLAGHYTGRSKVITRYRSYHGATGGAITFTGDPRRWPAEPGMPGVVRMLDPYTYRCPAGHPDPCPVCAGGPHLEELLMYENPDTVAAVLIEPVTGTNGLIYPPDGYLRSIRDVCDRHGILLIFDEVMAGFGRTGRWFACDHWDVAPDILCVAKGINSGYVPLGAMIVSEPIATWLDDRMFWGGQTYSGHPLACATGVESIHIYRDEQIVERAHDRGELLGDLLDGLAERHPSIGEVRGRGLFYGVELVRNRTTREPLVPFNAKGSDAAPMREVMSAAMKAGLYLSSFSNVVRLTPPLIISPEEVRLGVDILDDVLTLADAHYTGS